MSPHGGDMRGAGIRIRATIAALAVTLLLAGCFTPSRSATPTAAGGSASKQTFLTRLIGLCAGVDNRLQAAGWPPAKVADELQGMVQQVVAEQIPEQDRDKFNAMIVALLAMAATQRAVAESAASGGTPATPAPTAKQAAKSAMDAADAAAVAYGMPHLADCPKKVKVQAADWQPRNPAPLAVQQAGSAVVQGAVWVVGGITADAATDRVSTYDPAIGTWAAGPNLPAPLHHPMAVSYHDELVVLGGFTPRGSQLTGDTSAAVYRLRGGQWETMPSLTYPRAAGAAVVVGDKIVVVGGRNTEALVQPTEIFDGTRWQVAEALPVPGDHLAAVTDGTFVYVVGGRDIGADKNTAALQRFDPAQGHWTRLQDMPAPRGGLAAVYVDGRIVTAGGEGVNTVYADCDEYDIKAGTWSALASLHTARHGLAMAAIGSRIFAIGGATHPTHTGSTDTVSELDLDQSASATTSATPQSPSPSPSPSAGSALGEAGACPGGQESAVRACLTRATLQPGRLKIAYTVNVPLSTIQDSSHRHLHFFLANPDGHGGTDPDASVMQMTAPQPQQGSWFNIYSPHATVIDGSTERGGRGQPVDPRAFSLLCVRVATGAHSLVADRSGHLRTGNCVTISR
jgi:N-acetylneuraminic acid mutarotase